MNTRGRVAISATLPISIYIDEVAMSTSIVGRRIAPVLLTVAVATMASGCEAIGAIFKAGVWTGVIAVVVLIGLLAFVAMKIGRS